MFFLRKSFCSPQNQLHVRLDWSLWLNKEISWKGHRKENPITTFSLKTVSENIILIFKVKGKERHLNFRSKSVLFEKNTNTTVNISITLFLSLPFN